MAMPTLYNRSLNESLQKQQQILPRCRYPEAEYIYGAISADIFVLVDTDIYFVVKD